MAKFVQDDNIYDKATIEVSVKLDNPPTVPCDGS